MMMGERGRSRYGGYCFGGIGRRMLWILRGKMCIALARLSASDRMLSPE